MKTLRSMLHPLATSMALFGSICLMQNAYAATGICMPSASPNNATQINVDFTKTYPNPSENVAGQTLVNVSAGFWNKPTYVMNCDCDNPPKMQASYIRAVTPLPLAGFDVNGLTGYILNDYLAISSEIWIAGNVKKYVAIPFPEMSNGVSDQFCEWAYDTGATGMLHLYFRRPFIGQQVITPVKLIDIFISSKPNSGNATPAVNVWLSGTVTVPQSCVISPDPITINLGDIMSSKFKTAGAMPDGFTPVKQQITVACQNISEGVKVDLTLSSEPDSKMGDALKTTNNDIAIKIKDGNGNEISPVNGAIPVNMTGLGQQESTGQAEINVYPVNTTGNTPAVGVFNNVTGTIKVEIQ
ncbi:fimbrial protein [Serratia sp. Ag2]|nr:fimbrial protein [Serratia sp. Ag2]